MYLRRQDGLGSVLLIKNEVTGACGVAAGGVPCAAGGYQIPRCGFPRGPACMRPLTPCPTPVPVLPVSLRERVPYPVSYGYAQPGIPVCRGCSFPSPSASTVAASYVTGVAGLGQDDIEPQCPTCTIRTCTYVRTADGGYVATCKCRRDPSPRCAPFMSWEL